jgi:2-C-methyl-D-erythritol 4-phosphate cytidylyltransferase
MVTALILSGGTGTRVGSDMPKQYIEVGSKPVLSYCIETLSKSKRIDAIWIVAADIWQDKIMEWLEIADVNKKFKGFSKPGKNRQLSIYNGLTGIKKMAADDDYVLVHDASRPCLLESEIADCLDAVKHHDGVVPVLPMKDTVYLSTNHTSITSLLDRSQVFAGQAPELFVLGKYLQANDALIVWSGQDGLDKVLEISPESPILRINGSTEPAIMAGMKMAMIPGNEGNFKITTRADLERFQSMTKELR